MSCKVQFINIYNYPPYRSSELKLDINQINTQYEIIKLESMELMDFL